MENRGKIKALIYSFPVIALVALGVLAMLMSRNQAQLNMAEENRYQSYLIAGELRQSSEDLTRLARTFVCTGGNAKYEQAYNLILQWRSGIGGRAPRPNSFAIHPGETILQVDIMKELGFAPEEFAKLKEAGDNSNDLVATEVKAMNAIKGFEPDGKTPYAGKEPAEELARRIMFDEKYHSDKAKIMAPIDDFFRLLDQRTKTRVAQLETQSDGYLYAIFGCIVFLGLSSILTVWTARKSLVASLEGVIGRLTTIVGSVSRVSGQFSSTSHSLARGASEQAAALEETSASLEEISSMAKRTADNAHQANDLAKQTRAAADKGVADMQSMSGAVAEIKKSSDEISKIIKTIDEIAFQTNILALNAAVESARAGEAGMGFAVVADEVRSLAQRSSQAAKETAQKIEDSIRKTAQGVELSGKVAAALDEIVGKARQMDTIAAEVAGASNEQSRGIMQVNQAVSQMDKVTQLNAASAEEGASSAEELSGQAGAMEESVGALLQLLGRASTVRLAETQQ